MGSKDAPTKGTLVAPMPAEMSRGEIQAEVLHKLKRRHRWGKKYTPTDSLVSWIGSQETRDGDQVREAIEDLVKCVLLQRRKKGNTVSLNPPHNGEIEPHLNRYATNKLEMPRRGKK